MNYNKIRRNVKAISPVISVLLMIAVAVAASLVAYAWVMGYMGFTFNKTGKAMQVQSIAINSGATDANITYVQNVGDSDLKLSSFYINGVLDLGASAQIGTDPAVILNGVNTLTLPKSETVAITSVIDFTVPQVAVKAVSTDGTSAEYTKTFP